MGGSVQKPKYHTIKLQHNCGPINESISFEVEKKLSRPNKLMYASKIEYILSKTFQNGEEILHYNFDTNEEEFWNGGKKSLLNGLMLAYQNHYPITVSPDMLLILFLQGYSRFMEKYAEKFRNQYVNFEGKKSLTVVRKEITPKTATKEEWQGIIDEFLGKIKESVGEEIISNMQSNFTTTNSVTLATSQLTIMSTMKQYFKYEEDIFGCGISSITLEGSLEDWEKLKKKFEFLSKKEFGLNWWMEHLIPIIDKIIETKKHYIQNKNINNKIRNFWKDMIRLKIGGIYKPSVIDGWIVKFIPNLTEEEPKVYEKLKDKDIPDEIIFCPMKLTFKTLFSETEYDCGLYSGFYGMIQDESDYTVKPVIGYSIVVEEKK